MPYYNAEIRKSQSFFSGKNENGGESSFSEAEFRKQRLHQQKTAFFRFDIFFEAESGASGLFFSIPVPAVCFATGQACGAMAHFAASTGTEMKDLVLADIRRLLRAHGAIVPD